MRASNMKCCSSKLNVFSDNVKTGASYLSLVQVVKNLFPSSLRALQAHC